jgi:hypothetical protein
LAKAGGTNSTLTSAPVSDIASATVANTGMPSTSVPAFLGLTPPTTFVPEATIGGCAWCPPSR